MRYWLWRLGTPRARLGDTAQRLRHAAILWKKRRFDQPARLAAAIMNRKMKVTSPMMHSTIQDFPVGAAR